MAASDDECDLDTLSALLEEHSNDSVPMENAIHTSSEATDHIGKGMSEAVHEAKEISAQSSLSLTSVDEKGCNQDKHNDCKCKEENELDETALTSLLEDDSDIESMTTVHASEVQQDKDMDEISAEALAAFFDENSDSEDDGCQQERQTECASADSNQDRRESNEETKVSSSGQGCKDGGLDTDVSTSSQEDPQHVQHLQDELMKMQKRMMEIQQLLASQTSPSVAGSSSLSTCTKEERRHSKGRAESTNSPSALPRISSPSSSYRKQFPENPSLASVRKQSPENPSLASVHSEKKHLPKQACSSNQKDKHRGSTDIAAGVNSVSAQSKGKMLGLDLPSLRNSNGVANAKNTSGIQNVKREIGVERKVNSFSGNSCSQAALGLRGQNGKEGEKRSSTFLMDVAKESNERSAGSGESDLKSALFGEDSNSDWEDMEGEKSSLSKEGMDIKRLLKKEEGHRQAHTPSYSLPSTRPASWLSRTQPQASQTKSLPGAQNAPQQAAIMAGSPHAFSHNATSSLAKQEPEDKDCATEKFSGLRIKNPKISSVMMRTKMEGRRMIPVSKLHLKVKSPELQSDWVTIGVIVQKSDSKKSQTGKTYSILKLSDLQDADTTVSLFLFGQVYKQLWKIDVGTIVGILNPSIMDSMEKDSGVAVTVKNAQQVMEIGQSRDLGWCIGRTKRGTTCNNFINKKLGDFCTYHVQAAYRKQSAKRSELHGSCPGTAPKSSLKRKILQNNTFFYGGETFTASRDKGNGSKDDKVTLAKLHSVVTQKDQCKVNTLNIQNLLPAGKAAVEAVSSQHEEAFVKMLSVPSVGSMNLVRHIAKTEGHAQGATGIKGKAAAFQSIKASDLIKQHQQQIEETLSRRKKEQSASSQSALTQKQSHQETDRASSLHKKKTQPVINGTNDKVKEKDLSKKISSENNGFTGKKKHKSKHHLPKDGNASMESPQSNKNRHNNTSDTDTVDGKCRASGQLTGDSAGGKTGAPVLGKGFYPGTNIDLSFDSAQPIVSRRPSSVEAAKRKAIQKVQATGGLGKVDPNAVRKPHNPETVRKRVLENIENASKEGKDGRGADACQVSEPARKKSRLFGNVDPDSEEVQQLLKARSSHTGALVQAEMDREEQYFDNLEKKEMMEEKMLSVTAMEVTVFTCEQCKYTAMSLNDRCKQERHVFKKHKGKRRFFACKKCKHRTVSLHRYPTSPCTNCGEHNFEKTSMHKEKTGPKLASETLCLRGDEGKFINSLEQKVYAATL